MIRLFDTPSQERELKAIRKIFDTPYIWTLCNDSFEWFAVNIPMNLLGDHGFEGDIDLTAKIPPIPIPNGRLGFFRCFEVKVSKVDKENQPKSLKLGKVNKICKQVEKLIDFGSENTFLLEIYILEPGYRDNHNFYNKQIGQAVAHKADIFKGKGFGYLVMPLEFLPSIDENQAGAYYPPQNILGANHSEMKAPLKVILEYLDDYFEKHRPVGSGYPIILFCKSCKKLQVVLYNNSDVLCEDCGAIVF